MPTCLAFYEKVVKVKADVAAIIIFFSRTQIEADNLDTVPGAPNRPDGTSHALRSCTFRYRRLTGCLQPPVRTKPT